VFDGEAAAYDAVMSGEVSSCIDILHVLGNISRVGSVICNLSYTRYFSRTFNSKLRICVNLEIVLHILRILKNSMSIAKNSCIMY